MKKQHKCGPLSWRFPKMDLKMKLTTIFLVVSLFQVQANSYGQKTKLSLDLEDVSIGQVFSEIEEISEFRFMFESGQIDLERKVSLRVSKKKITDVLPLLFGGTDVNFKIRGRQVILTTKVLGVPLPLVDAFDDVLDGNGLIQQKVTGTVADAEGVALAGANILEKGTTNGTQTDFDGNFSIDVGDDAILVVSYIGFATKEVNLDGQSSISISLEEDAASLDEVVVTAFGLERKKNTLPYAAQQVNGDEVNQTKVSNVASGLSGKVSGLQITQGNGIGGSVNVVIRGSKSLTGNNQALFVVDGIPVDNSNTNSTNQQNGVGGYDYGNAAADINPNDIETINVLKGAAASALYGSRAANGVIMITTKKAKSGLNLSFDTGVVLGTIDNSTFVEYQRDYGAGRSDFYDRDGFLLSDVNGDGTEDLVVPTFAPRSWGPRYNANLLVYGWDAFDSTSPFFQTPKPWVAPENGPNTFYQTSVITNNSILLDGKLEDKGTFKIGYTRNDEKGVLPNSKITKNIFNLNASYNIFDNLSVSALVNYSQIEGRGRYGTGYDSARNINTNFRHFNETNYDIQEQRDAYFRTRQNITWNWADPTTEEGIRPAFYNNPYWVVYENFENDQRNRVFGNVSLTYNPTDWLQLLARISIDDYREFQQERVAVGSVGVSSYSRFDRSFNETNYDLLATAEKQVNDDFNISGLLGVNIRRNTISSVSSTTSGGLVVPKLYSISNSAGTVPAPLEAYQPKAIDGYFGGLTLTYNDFLTLDGTIRRDISSTLPEDNNAYNYYAISGSYLFSKHFEKQAWLSYGKIRANYATVGNDAPWGSIKDVYDKPNPFGPSLVFSLPSTKNNDILKPEMTKSKEVGLEMAFFKNRLGFDLSYYHTNTVDQIIPVAVSQSIGYASKFINAGDIENKGFEVSLYGYPIRTDDFSWNVSINWTRNRNRVLSLFNDSKNLQLGSFQGGVSLNASIGRPYGELQSATYEMLDGQRLIRDNGLYQITTTTSNVIGNVNPDWVGGVFNRFQYKDFALSFLVDVRQGGDLFSLDMYYGSASGILPSSVGINDLGNPVRDNVEDGGGIILQGVTADGQPNTQRVTITSNNSFYQPQSQFVYDASFVKLRELSLSYSLPDTFLSEYVKDVELSIIGRNLWIIDKNVPFADPEENLSSGNIQGYQSGSYPSVRTIGFNINVKL